MSELFQALARDLAHADLAQRVNADVALYHRTGDARHFWRAYLRLRSAREPITEDIMSAIDDMARGALAAQTPEGAAQALGFAGSAGEYKSPRLNAGVKRRLRLAHEVKMLVDRPVQRPTVKTAIAAVARNRGVTEALVKKAYCEFFVERRTPAKSAPASNGNSLADAMKLWR